MQGIGDDCARVAPRAGHELAITTDLLVEGRHFLPDADPAKLGHKCLAVNLSDLAAAGATPRWFTLAICLPSVDETWLEEFASGMFALAKKHKIELVGGDTTRGPARTIDITALGLVHPEIASAAQRLHQPQPRVALGQKLRGLAGAAIDVSDGLAGDLGHILERSRVGAIVDYDRIPKEEAFQSLRNEQLERDCVLAGGDDYELLFTSPKSKKKLVQRLGATLIGEITKERKLRIEKNGRPVPHKPSFDHFA